MEMLLLSMQSFRRITGLLHRGPSLNRALTHQHVLQFDIPMDKPLAVQKADSLHHIQSYLQTCLQGQPSLGREKSPTP